MVNALTDDRWTGDPDELAARALRAPRCECPDPVVDGDECAWCGREIRALGTLGREFRLAAYDRRLRWARGMGVHPRTGFRGLAAELGPNPPLEALDAALAARVDELVTVDGDPFAADLAELMAA
jgi:hypothetical protein